MAVAKLEILLFWRALRSSQWTRFSMKRNRGLSLRENADTTRHVSASPANGR